MHYYYGPFLALLLLILLLLRGLSELLLLIAIFTIGQLWYLLTRYYTTTNNTARNDLKAKGYEVTWVSFDKVSVIGGETGIVLCTGLSTNNRCLFSKLTRVTSYPFAFKPFLGFLIGSLHTVHCFVRGQFDIQHLQYSPPVWQALQTGRCKGVQKVLLS